MKKAPSKLPVERDSRKSLLLRGVIALNVIRFVLSFIPFFEGTDQGGGIADAVFPLRMLGGFRIDFIWLILTTLLIFFALIYNLFTGKDNPKARTDAYLCLGWLILFIVYIVRGFLTGVIAFA